MRNDDLRILVGIAVWVVLGACIPAATATTEDGSAPPLDAGALADAAAFDVDAGAGQEAGVGDRLAADIATADSVSGDSAAADHLLNDAGTTDSADAHVGPSCDADALTGYYCAGDKVSNGATSTLYFCEGPGLATVAEVCASGCVIAPDGQDDHCAADAATCEAAAVTGSYCAGDEVAGGTAGTLYLCNGPGPASVAEVCASSCTVAPAGQDDHCAPAAATCDADAVTGYYCAGDKVTGGDADTLYHCSGPGVATLSQACAHGCFVAPAGQDDYCASAAATCDGDAVTGYYCAGDKVTGGVANTLYHCSGPGPATVAETCSSSCVVAAAGSDDYCAGSGSAGYKLPFACGTARRCSNGNNTSSHTGTDLYAYDFAMPVGTSVRAIRSGVVQRVRIVSTPGSACYDGGGSSCANLANTVELRHSDGTIALYMHITTSSVSTGQHVNQGQEVAKSGNTGWSTGPHLHNQVQTNCGSWWCQSLEFDFVEAPNLTTGMTVTSQNCP
ncbi:MAG: M23 family metallopeptidase [Pseudomonadota bacterium]